MKSLRFQEVLLLSNRERSARRVSLDPKITIIRGNNDTGKSALLKSIYAMFGATAAVVHPRWLTAEVVGVVRFTVDDVPYSILRTGEFYGVFDSHEQLLIATNKVVTGLGTFLADLLDYRIVLTARGGGVVPPPPKYFFLPFYVDQDKGWTANWSSFARLGQISDWRRSMVEFHTGIRPNGYYTAKAALASAQTQLRDAKSERTVLERMFTQVRPEIVPTFDVDIESFQAQIKDLLDECNGLKAVEEQLSGKLTELYSLRYTLQSQLHIATSSLAELSKDYEFATDDVLKPEVECPTCGALYSNSFADRFGIAEDEDHLAELIVHLRQELGAAEESIRVVSEEHSNRRDEITRISALLDQRQNEVTMRTLIQSEGKKELNAILRDRIGEAQDRVSLADTNVSQRRASLKDFEDPDRRSLILERYHSLMRSYLNELKVFTLPESLYRQISCNISETGSDLPRALLAYYFSILTVMEEYSTSTFCPIIVDSPNQQGQDAASIRIVLQFIRDHQPQAAQMILAIEEPLGVEFGGSGIELNDKYRLLRGDQYHETYEVVHPLLTKAIR
jgi:hypothetical protein